MTTAKPPARYGAIWGRACGRLCSTELHHQLGHDPVQTTGAPTPFYSGRKRVRGGGRRLDV